MFPVRRKAQFSSCKVLIESFAIISKFEFETLCSFSTLNGSPIWLFPACLNMLLVLIIILEKIFETIKRLKTSDVGHFLSTISFFTSKNHKINQANFSHLTGGTHYWLSLLLNILTSSSIESCNCSTSSHGCNSMFVFIHERVLST